MGVIPQTFHFDARGVRIVGERWESEPGGRVVLLLHGGGQTRHSWKRTAERLSANGRTVVALDARGHGESGWDPSQDYAMDSFVADVIEFVSTLECPPVLVGASLGGITALIAAGEHPGLASGLVLVDIVVRVEPEGVARIRDFMTSAPNGFASLEEVVGAIAAYNPLRRRPSNLDGLRKNVRQHANGRWYWHWDPAFMRIDDEPQRRIDPERLRVAAAHLTIPTLLVRGARSDVVSDDGLADMLALIPHAQSIDVQAAGHMVAGDDNDVFAEQLEAFVDQIDGVAT